MPNRNSRRRRAAYTTYPVDEAIAYGDDSYPQQQYDDPNDNRFAQQYDLVGDDGYAPPYDSPYNDQCSQYSAESYLPDGPTGNYDYRSQQYRTVEAAPPPQRDGDSLPIPSGWVPLTAEELAKLQNNGRGASSSAPSNSHNNYNPIVPAAQQERLLGFKTVEDLCKAFISMKEQHGILKKKIVELEASEKGLAATLARYRESTEKLELKLYDIYDRESNRVSIFTQTSADFPTTTDSSTDTDDLHPRKTAVTNTPVRPTRSIGTETVDLRRFADAVVETDTTSSNPLFLVNAVETIPPKIPSLSSLKFDRDPRETLVREALSVGLKASLHLSAEDSELSKREEGHHRRSGALSCSRRGDKQRAYGRRPGCNENARSYRHFYPRRINPRTFCWRPCEQSTSFPVPIYHPNLTTSYCSPRRSRPVAPTYSWTPASSFPRDRQASANGSYMPFVPFQPNSVPFVVAPFPWRKCLG